MTIHLSTIHTSLDQAPVTVGFEQSRRKNDPLPEEPPPNRAHRFARTRFWFPARCVPQINHQIARGLIAVCWILSRCPTW